MSRPEPASTVAGPGGPALDRLAAVAVAVAAIPIPMLGIAHPAVHLLVIAVLAVFAWLWIRATGSLHLALRGMHLGWRRGGAGWVWVAAAAAATAVGRWLLDAPLLQGRGGIDFYRHLLLEQGVIDAGGTASWELLAVSAPIVYGVILIDGVFFSGLIQRRIAAHTNVHAGVHVQAVLFALPHIFAGPAPDPIYGLFTYLAGLAYGYVYARTRSHWMPAALLWLHVMLVWLILSRG